MTPSIPPRFRRARAVALVILLSSLGVPLASSCRRPAPQETGELLYRRYCASCHGTDGAGNGPAAGALCPPPPDLAQLSYGIPEILRQIDGRRTIRGHGSAAMPVWGEVFEQSLIAEAHTRRTALLRAQAIAEYVHRLRERKQP